MRAQADKTQESKSQLTAETISRKASESSTAFHFTDKRPEAAAQRKLQDIAGKSVKSPFVAEWADRLPVQKKESNTGLPDNLKSGIENLSGYAMDDVKVHYDSEKPSQLQAHAYAQGTAIHVAPGQEKYLPHEAWHVVQQKQGRVKPTMQLKGSINVNDDEGLEKEADLMGDKAMQKKAVEGNKLNTSGSLSDVAQLQRIEHKGIKGLTHLVKMTPGGSLYNGEDWLDNERDEVTFRDILTVDMDNGWYSHRGINQEENWEEDGAKGHDHLWVHVMKLNHKTLKEKDLFVREEMLNDGLERIPKKMHSVWVQGDYRGNKEAETGMATRQGMRSEDGWVNMMWLYNSGIGLGGFDSEVQRERLEVDTGAFREVVEKSFVDEMRAWRRKRTMPEWVENWLPILEILYEKKSYITMSDIMRMIILYYEGGVYMDVKIKVDVERTAFQSSPMLLVNTVNFYDRENWAIMANAGCRMIEEIMTQTLAQFPDAEELGRYPENYAQEQGREGRMHVDLHEDRGVWNIIERVGRIDPTETLKLTNPRVVNSWTHPYDDRPARIRLTETIAAKEKLEREGKHIQAAELNDKIKLLEMEVTAEENPPEPTDENAPEVDYDALFASMPSLKKVIEPASDPDKNKDL